MKITKKIELKGFKKAKLDGGISANDNYNKAYYGITQSKYQDMQKILVNKYGFNTPLTTELKISDFDE